MQTPDPALSVFRRAWFDGLCPPEQISVTEWAEKYRVLSGEGSVHEGPYRVELTPYVREIMDALHPDSDVRRVVWMKGSQVGGSECGNNWIGFLIDCAPAPAMIIQPTLDAAKRYSRTRISPMLRDSPRLAEIIPPGKSRDSDNTIFAKHYRGTVLLIAGANSAAMLRSQALRYLMLDEVDNWPLDVDGEGDPCKLAEARLRMTWARRKIFMLSSPKLKGNSRIEQAFLEGDQCYWFVPCPDCNTFQRLVFGHLKWDKGQPETARYACEACGSLIDESHKEEMIARGEWRATATPTDPETRSFHVSSLYSPPGAMGWGEIAAEFEQAHASGSPLLLQVFVNTILGETWAGSGEAPPAHQLYERSRNAKYSSGMVPNEGLLLTAGVDVQKDRLECEVVALGKNGQRYSIEYFILPGEHVLPAVWQELDKLLLRSWPHESGASMQIERMAVDCAFDQSVVAKWIRRQAAGRVLGIHGSDRLPIILGQPRRADVSRGGRTLKRGFALWPVGVSIAKTELYGRLRIPAPTGDDPYPPGFCHFPKDYGITYFEQLTSEKLEFQHSRGGASKPVWVKAGRNEALDCAVYARAAAAAYGIDRMKDAHWDRIAGELGVAPAPTQAQAPIETKTSAPVREQPSKPVVPDKSRSPRGGGWMSRWRGGRN